ncbi:MAG: GNAT family protein [Deinococcales bacterium]
METPQSLVYLRPVKASELDLLITWTNDIEHTSEYNFFGYKHVDYIREEYAKNGLLDPRGGSLLVIEKLSDDILGTVGYHQISYGPNDGSKVYNIGISLSPEHRNKGYGSEAQRLFAAYLFETYTIMRIEASTDISNLAEQRALEKAGFSREGIARQAQWRKGAWHDLMVYSKLRGEV